MKTRQAAVKKVAANPQTASEARKEAAVKVKPVSPATRKPVLAVQPAPASTKKGHGLVGITSGLNKTEWYVLKLRENETAKRSDAELQKIFDAEFPDTVHYVVAAMRAKLNRGGWGDRGFKSTCFTPADRSDIPKKAAIPPPERVPRARLKAITASGPSKKKEG